MLTNDDTGDDEFEDLNINVQNVQNCSIYCF